MAIGKDGRAEPTDVDLMLRVRRGDADAFARLYRRYHRKLLDFFYAMGAGPSFSEDLCQETLLRLWRLRARYEPRGSFPAFLFTVARYVWMERRTEVYRSMARRPEIDEAMEPAAPGGEPDALASRSEAAAAIAKAVADLPEEQRMAFVLRAVEGLPLEEIADALDCPVNTVRSRKLLAVRKLREVLRGLLAL